MAKGTKINSETNVLSGRAFDVAAARRDSAVGIHVWTRQHLTIANVFRTRVRYTVNPYSTCLDLLNDLGLLFRKFTIPTNPKSNPMADPNPNFNPNLSPNVSTVARICIMDFRNSGPVPVKQHNDCAKSLHHIELLDFGFCSERLVAISNTLSDTILSCLLRCLWLRL